MEYKVVLREDDINRLLDCAFESDGNIEVFLEIEEEDGVMESMKNPVLTLVSNKPIKHKFYF